MKASSAIKLQRLLQRLFASQAREVASKISLDRDPPDMQHWVDVTAEACQPLLLAAWQQGMMQSAARISGKRNTVEGAVGRTPTNPGAKSFLAVVGQQRTVPSIFLKNRSQVICKAKQTDLDFSFDLFNPKVLNAVDAATYAFCQNTMATATDSLQVSLDKLRALMRTGLPRGDAIQLLAREIRTIFADPGRAFRIATTETSRAMHGGGALAAVEAGITHHTWLASSDACDRPSGVTDGMYCQELDGKTVAIGTPFWVNPKGGSYASVLYPPLHPHCLLPETPVTVPDLVVALKARFSGTCYRITLVNGNEFACTPNHMLLTPIGLLCVKDIMQGDRVIHSRLRERVNGSNPDDNRKPRLAKEIFDTFAVANSVSASCVPTSAEYLHGDAALCQGNIDVVKTKSFLRDEHNARIRHSKHVDKPFFKNRGRTLSLVSSRQFELTRFGHGDAPVSFTATDNRQPFDGFGKFDLARLLHRLASFCSVGGVRHKDAILLAQHRVGIGMFPGSDAELLESFDNRVAGNAILDRQLIGGCAGKVIPRDLFHREVDFVGVSHVRPFDYNGFVYDFSTQSSLYTINGVISSNCFCSVVEEID